jgi:acetaldehyde dehydrogenase
VPVVNGDAHLDAPNVNMVTCGGQATIPIVAAVSHVTRVHYAEIVASIASKSAGPGTRANIDEFTETTSRAIESLGGAMRGKAIIVLNPAEPPMIMRDTVFCLTDHADADAIRQSIESMVGKVRQYVPGYRLQQSVQFEPVGASRPFHIPEMPKLAVGGGFSGLKISVFLSCEGAADYLPAYAGNLDIMTSAALQTAEKIAAWLHARKAA